MHFYQKISILNLLFFFFFFLISGYQRLLCELRQRGIAIAAAATPSPVEATAAAPTFQANANATPKHPPVVVVEFCAGTGSLALPLAACLPQVQFVLVDAKRRSLDIAQRRVERAGLRNVEIVEGLVQELRECLDPENSFVLRCLRCTWSHNVV